MCVQPRWCGFIVVLALTATAALWSRSSTAQQPGDDKSFEKSLDAGLRDVINLGAEIFNKQNDHAGCYRLFEGSLRSIKPLLGKYPKLQTRIDNGLAEAAKQPRVHDKAHALRKVLDEIREAINPGAPIVAKTSLWDRLGGEKGVDKVLSEFMAAAAADPKVDFTRGGTYKLTEQDLPVLKKSLLDFVSSATGGPYQYKGKSMKDVHKGMGITDAQFDALAGHLKTALERNGVKAPDIAAVMEAVGSTRNDIVEGAPGKKAPAPANLWDRLGGEKGVDKVLTDFIGAAALDPKVDFTRGGKYKFDETKAQALKKSLIDFVSDATGGPFKYTGPSMKDVHKGMGITDAQFDALAGHLKEALEKSGVLPDDVKAVLGAVSGTRADIVESKVEPKVEPKKGEENKPGKKAPPPPDPNMARVKGVVTIGGEKLTHGFVTFLDAKTDKRYSANVQKDGNFVFHKGFPPGEYKVLLEETPTPAVPGEKRLTIPLQYTAPILSTLNFSAAKGENTMNLTLDPK
jgi:hemoglobin